jgi:hypothetical protein
VRIWKIDVPTIVSQSFRHVHCALERAEAANPSLQEMACVTICTKAGAMSEHIQSKRRLGLAALSLCIVAIGSAAEAQAIAHSFEQLQVLVKPGATAATGQDTPVQRKAQLAPVTVSVGVGPIVTTYQTISLPRPVSGWTGTGFLVEEPSALMGSVQVRIRPSVFLEGAVTYASGARALATTQGERAAEFFGGFVDDTTFLIDEAISETSIVGNLMVPVGISVPRVSTFVGGGGGVRATSTRLDTLLLCAPRQPTGCEGRPDVERHERGTAFAPLLQLNYGIDVLIQPRLSGFAALRWPFVPASDEDDVNLTGFGMTAGVRLGLGGKIFETSDGRKGERAPSQFRTGTMLGLVGGGIVGGIWGAQSSSDDTRGAAPPLMSLIGVGVGAGVGALLDAVR